MRFPRRGPMAVVSTPLPTTDPLRILSEYVLHMSITCLGEHDVTPLYEGIRPGREVRRCGAGGAHRSVSDPLAANSRSRCGPLNESPYETPTGVGIRIESNLRSRRIHTGNRAAGVLPQAPVRG